MTEKILILDFGSQYTQLIARAVREANVFCEIIPYYKPFEPDELVAAIQNIFNRVRRTHRRVARLAAPVNTASTAAATASFTESTPDSELTETEMRVALAAARGLSNKDIAANLGISYRTVEMHVSHILAKKHLSNRVELARYMIEREQKAQDEA